VTLILSSLFGIGKAFAQNINSHSPRMRTLRAESTIRIRIRTDTELLVK
jgi:hypothetical protein